MAEAELGLAQESLIHESIDKKLYTPNMIMVATFLGGLVAGCALIWANYKTLGEHEKAGKTLLWALGGILFFFLLSYFLPFVRNSGAGMSGALAFGLRAWAKTAFPKQAPKASWWLTILISILALLGSLILLIVLSVMFSIVFPQFK